MAEALGLAASVFSVASLAIQLGDSLQKACEFWDSITEGPDDIRRISTELRLLANIIQMLEREDKAGMLDRAQEQLIKGALELAQRDINELANLVTDLSRATGPGQKNIRWTWGRVQIVLKAGKMSKLKAYIESAKSILNLLQASRAQSAICQMNGRLDMLAATFSSEGGTQVVKNNVESFSESQQQASSSDSKLISPIDSTSRTNAFCDLTGIQVRTRTSLKSVEFGLGGLSLRSTSKKFRNLDNDREDEKSSTCSTKTFVVNLLWGFSSCRRGFRLMTNDTFDSLTFNTIRRRPLNSPIFSLCCKGDTKGVQKLLLFEEASVFDVDSSGWSPLHWACRYGHAELTKFLIERGADPFLGTDNDESPIMALEYYDLEMGNDNDPNIVQILDAFLRHTDLDPFDFKDRINGLDAISLWNGIPYDILPYLFSRDMFYATREQSCFFILENILQYNDQESSHDGMNFLLIEYEKLWDFKVIDSRWLCDTLLQTLVPDWIWDDLRLKGSARKISRVLKLTNDLYHRSDGGTPLDTIAKINVDKIGPWLRLLQENDINLSEYGRHEESQHLDGIIYQGSDICCRAITVEFKFGETDNDLVIEAHDICDPRFAHLDPNYRCEAGRQRENCISQMDDAFIDEDGKPIASLPGSWSSTMKPNSDLLLVIGTRLEGLLYTDCLIPGDFIFHNPHTEAESEHISEPQDAESDSDQESEPDATQTESDGKEEVAETP